MATRTCLFACLSAFTVFVGEASVPNTNILLPSGLVYFSPGLSELAVEDCGPDEVFLECGWCEPTCSEPNPVCPLGQCTKGCLCRPPLLRHHSTQCVSSDKCTPRNCTNSNEEYGCLYTCEPRCDSKSCPNLRSRGCVLGCHCLRGFYRHTESDQCVTAANCSTLSETIINDSMTNTTLV